MIAAVGHTATIDWLWVIVPIALLAGTLGWLWRSGGQGPALHRIATSLERVTGLPAWCAGGVMVAMWSLTVAVVGFFWDVAWHIDLGRDTELFTVPHTLIFIGLLGLGLASLFSIGLATVERAPTAWHLRRLRIPRGALALGLLSAGAALGFPLDDLWHATYGVDVTMWGPTHLMMIGGASLAPLAMWVLVAEAGPEAGTPRVRAHLRRSLAEALIVGVSTFQLEFDYGVPQWQALYQPVLIAVATSIALVAARTAFGRGWALIASLHFVAVRGVLALLVGPGLDHVVPRFPLYIGIGLAVELAFFLARRRGLLMRALLTGLSVGTLGLATEWGFTQLWGRHPWQASMLPSMWVAVLGALGGAVIGIALGRAASHRRVSLPRPVLGGAFAAVVLALLIPLPRSTAPVTAVVHATPSGAATPAVTRDGLPAPLQPVDVRLTVSPADAMHGADWFEALSWQGGGSQITRLVEVAPGEYRTASPVPTGGTWKTIVWVARHDVLMSTPISMPVDLQYGQAPITPHASEHVTFVASRSLLMRESHDGAVWPAIVAYGGLLGLTLLWIGVLVAGFASIDRGTPGGGEGRGRQRNLERSLRGRRAAHVAGLASGR
ncbi:MAG TPA: hypothetical protein VGQ42_09110 [Candidatus Dormibacteraeota bacterium]|jgi:hypothetical protein|nr:hypothetical protein [Candidatus Dormibacteraeota bacterium]